MPRYEYKVVPAPTKGLKAKGVRGAEARFSYAVQELMNGLSGYGWEYQRAETLPSIERSGLTGSTTEWRNVLVFRRLRESDAEAFAPELLPAPEPASPTQLPETPPVLEKVTSVATAAPVELPTRTADTSPETSRELIDNGVEDTSDVDGVTASLEQLAAARNISKSDD